MASRKEDEKNERIIRSLLKLPDNRRCVNCNSLGPQYVCINFWTFICTNCSGIHREFTHRVKSVSMAKFTSQEVSALQGGGNASAKEIYLKEWDPQRQSLPDGSNVERLRDFIKHVYVERRYTGERSLEKPPKPKMNESEDFNDHRLKDYYQGGSRSPPYDEANERRYSDRSSSGGRSPGYDLESRQHSDYQSPARTEVVNDWRREDRFGNVRKSEDTRTADGGSRPLDSRSPDRQRDLGASSPPVVRPVREILGENIAPLRVIEPPKANGFRSPDSSVRTQRTESSSSLASSNGNPAELRAEASLIDFDDVPAPPLVASLPQPQPPPQAAAAAAAGGLHTVQTAQSDGGNWARFDSVADVKSSHAATNVNPLESVIAELLVPFSGSPNLGSGALTSASTTASNTPAFPSMLPVATNASPFGSVAPPATAHPISQQPFPGANSFGFDANFAQQPQAQQQFPFPAFGGQSVVQSFPVETSNNQVKNSIPIAVPNQQWFHSAATVQMPHSAARPNVGSTSGVSTQNSSVNAVASERKALPEDLFAFNYSPYPAPVRGWHNAPQHGMGFPAQYNMPMPAPTYPQASQPAPTYPQASKSTNPFDVGNDPAPAPAAMFPSVSSLQDALPTMSAPGGQHHASSHGLHAAPPSALYSHAPPHPTLIHQNAYLGQQLPGNMPSRPHGQGQYGFQGGSGFGAFNANQQLGGLQSTSYTPNTLSSTGGSNPFG